MMFALTFIHLFFDWHAIVYGFEPIRAHFLIAIKYFPKAEQTCILKKAKKKKRENNQIKINKNAYIEREIYLNAIRHCAVRWQ